MPILNDEIKAEIVTKLAHYDGYSEIAKAISAEHNVAVDRFQIRSYDPTNTLFAAGERWRAMFEKERNAYVNDISGIPIAHRAFRLNELQKIYSKAIVSRNLVLASSVLEQAAKEAGGALTNERHLKVTSRVDAMTAYERRAAFVELVKKAVDTKDLVPSIPMPSTVQ